MQDVLKTPGNLLLTVLRQWFCSKAVVLFSCFMLFDVGVSGRFSYSIVGY